MGKGSGLRPLSCIRRSGRPWWERSSISESQWCLKHRPLIARCDYHVPSFRRRNSRKRSDLKLSDSSGDSGFKEIHFSNVIIPKPQLAPEFGVKKGLDFKSSLRACSARIRSERDSEIDIQEKLSKSQVVITTSTPRIAKHLRSISKMRFFLLHKHKALEEKKKKNLKAT